MQRRTLRQRAGGKEEPRLLAQKVGHLTVTKTLTVV